MSVSTLANTKWIINNTVGSVPIPPVRFSVTFISNGNNYTELTLSYAGSDSPIKYDNTIAYDYGNMIWTNQAYRIIEITGGTNVTNASLIAWLEANATQVPVVDLTGCTWVGNDTIYANSFGSIKNVNFKERNTTYNSLYCSYDGIDNMIHYGSSLVYESGWFSVFYKTITFTGGTDIANPDLIVWLQANGTLTVPTPTKTFDLSTLGLSAGTHNIRVKARASGYKDSNFSNSVSYVVVASGFNITFNFSYTDTPECAVIYEDYDISSPIVHTFNNGTPYSSLTEVVSLPAGTYYIYAGNYIRNETHSATGGNSVSPEGTSGWSITIVGDGTIDLSVSSWD